MDHHWFSCPALDGEDLFFVLSEWPILFKLHIPTNKINVEYVLPFDLIIPNKSDYVSLAKSNDLIIIFPHYGDNIIEYNIEKKSIIKIDIAGRVNKKGNGPLYNYIYTYKEKIIAQGVMTTTLIVYDTEHSTYSYVNIAKLFHSKYGLELEEDSFTTGVVEKRFLYIPLKEKNQIIKIDLDNWELDVITVGREGDHWNSIVFYQDKLYLSAANNLELLAFGVKNKRTTSINIAGYADWIAGQERKGWPFSRLVLVDGTIFGLPFYADSFVKYDVSGNTFTAEKISLGEPGTVCEAYYSLGQFWSFVRQKDEDYILLYDRVRFDKIPINWTKDIVGVLLEYYKETKWGCVESITFKINDMLKFI